MKQQQLIWPVIISVCWFALVRPAIAQAPHPNLILTTNDVTQIRAKAPQLPVFQASLNKIKAKEDAELEHPIKVPVPRDAGGGYTHEQHKRNYQSIYNLGVLYQLTANRMYANRAAELLLAYAKMYPALGEHPKKKEQSPGRLFWQSLNEAVWLVYTIQGYDAIVQTLGKADKQDIEQNLLRPMARFLSVQSPETFDKIHNHGTWAVAAVGMTGYVLGDDAFVQQALYGLDKTGNSGFLKQLDKLFSADGYYAEGPYYQRYALLPFLLFAIAIDNRDPQLNIFEHRDGILLKAIYSSIQLSYNHLFFPINDAIKDKGLDTIELVYGVSIAYGKTKDPALLSIAKQQPGISLTADGLAVAEGLSNKLEKPFPYRSMLFQDGASASQAGLAILRSDPRFGHQALVMKNTAQGQGHGHFDKLSWLFYDQGHEIIRDYGAARFLNVEAKYGGHYLPENTTWAKQTVAHNTLVVDETSHFDGKLSVAKRHAPQVLLFDIQPQIEIISAVMENAYPDTRFTRTMAMLRIADLAHPLIVDIMRVNSDKKHQYDLPIHYQGHIMDISFPVKANSKQMRALGKQNGYQHLWVKAIGNSERTQLPQVTWLHDRRFYTYSAMQTDDQSFVFTLLGAHDPNFNLRPESGVIQRVKARNHTFVSVLETHGEYNPTVEYTHSSHSNVKDIRLFKGAGNNIDYAQITLNSGKQWGLAIAYTSSPGQTHSIEVEGHNIQWQGYYHLFEH